MKTFKVNVSDSWIFAKRCACIGMFDSFHLAHQQLFKKTLEIAKEKRLRASVITFSGSFKKNKGYIFSEKQKINFLQKMGFDELIIIEFNERLTTMHPVEFENYLLQHGIVELVCGFNFKYGFERKGDIESLKKSNLFEVHCIHAQQFNDEIISTTRVVSAIENGNIQLANDLLGRFYCIDAVVVHGKKLGRTIGFPTANFDSDLPYVIPAKGIYVGKVHVSQQEYYGLISVGCAPTVTDNQKTIIETYILDFDKSIYGEQIRVSFIEKIRDEQKFESLEKLIQAMNRDKEYLIEYIKRVTS